MANFGVQESWTNCTCVEEQNYETKVMFEGQIIHDGKITRWIFL